MTTNRHGYSLIEIMIAATILTIIIAGAAATVNSTNIRSTLTREDIVATQAAQAQIAEIRSLSFSQVKANYPVNTNTTFAVAIYPPDVDPGNYRLKIASTEQLEGVVFIINDETPDEAAFGRDISPFDNIPDGVNLDGEQGIENMNDVIDQVQSEDPDVAGSRSLFPIDLNGDGDTADNALTTAELQIIPVVVVIRWKSQARGYERRLQFITVIVDK